MRVCRHRRSLNAGCYREAPIALTPQPEADQAAHQPLGLDSGPRFALTLAERTLTLFSASLSDARGDGSGTAISTRPQEVKWQRLPRSPSRADAPTRG